MFEIKKLSIRNHKVIKDVNLEFGITNEDYDKDEGIMTTVIIGKNGIGKSFLLKILIEIFKTVDILYNDLDEKKLPLITYYFSIDYLLDGKIYTISNTIETHPTDRGIFGNFTVVEKSPYKRNLHFKINGRNVNLHEIKLPTKIIASSMTITDKFPTPSIGSYVYKGIRNEQKPGTTGTRTLERNVVLGIIESLRNKHTTRDELSLLLKELGYKSKFEIRYKLRHKNVFLTGHLTPDQLKDIYKNWKQYFPKRSNIIWGANYFEKIQDDIRILNNICSFLNRCYNDFESSKKSEKTYDIFDINTDLIYDAETIQILSSLDIITFPEIKVYKEENEGYGLIESSSGETNQLCQFINIMSSIRNNSLIIIDEPENSSHPNWQIYYISWLQNIFKRYCDCHFIIATHSHFLLSDLNPKWSRIIALKKEGRNIVDISEGTNTFCWSTDDILYRIFEVRNTRNYVFESKIRELYQYVSNRRMNEPKAQQVLYELEKYILNNDDPLNHLIKIAKNAESK